MSVSCGKSAGRRPACSDERSFSVEDRADARITSRSSPRYLSTTLENGANASLWPHFQALPTTGGAPLRGGAGRRRGDRGRDGPPQHIDRGLPCRRQLPGGAAGATCSTVGRRATTPMRLPTVSTCPWVHWSRSYAQFVELFGIKGVAPGQSDPSRYDDPRARIATRFTERTRDEWSVDFDGTDAFVAPILWMSEASSHPHSKVRDVFVEHEGVVQPQPAPRFSRTPAARSPAGTPTGCAHHGGAGGLGHRRRRRPSSSGALRCRRRQMTMLTAQFSRLAE